jgi:hypothetical protein
MHFHEIGKGGHCFYQLVDLLFAYFSFGKNILTQAHRHTCETHFLDVITPFIDMYFFDEQANGIGAYVYGGKLHSVLLELPKKGITAFFSAIHKT